MKSKMLILLTAAIIIACLVSCQNSSDSNINTINKIDVSKTEVSSVDITVDTSSNCIVSETSSENIAAASSENIKENTTQKVSKKDADINIEEKEDYTGVYYRNLALEILTLANEQRELSGAKPLSFNEEYKKASDIRAYECSVYWSHTRPSGGTPRDVTNALDLYPSRLGENLAKHITSAEECVTGFMNSPSHREAMLDPDYVEACISVYVDKNQRAYVAFLFIK